jgi:hypothetical protein
VPRPPDHFWLRMAFGAGVIVLVFLALVAALFLVTLSY